MVAVSCAAHIFKTLINIQKILPLIVYIEVISIDNLIYM